MSTQIHLGTTWIIRLKFATLVVWRKYQDWQTLDPLMFENLFSHATVLSYGFSHWLALKSDFASRTDFPMIPCLSSWVIFVCTSYILQHFLVLVLVDSCILKYISVRHKMQNLLAIIENVHISHILGMGGL